VLTVFKKLGVQVRNCDPWNTAVVIFCAQARNLSRSRATAQFCIDKHKRLLVLMSSKDVPGLRHLIAQLLKRDASPKLIITQLERAIWGEFTPRGEFNESNLDMAFLAKALGGPRLLYALTKSHSLPSARSVFRNCRVPTLQPSLSKPTAEDVDHNISAFLDTSVRPPPTKLGAELPGMMAMVDNLAITKKICAHMPQDAMLGVSRKTAANIETSLADPQAIDKARAVLYDKPTQAKMASEATMVVIAPYADTEHYCILPLALSGTDKSKKGPALSCWLRVVIDAYKEHRSGSALHGPIWSIASDGDATFCNACMRLCMEVELDTASLLCGQLQDLHRLNYWTSRDLILGTCDPKHVIKCMYLHCPSYYTLAWGTPLNAVHILEELCAEGFVPEVTVRQLLNPQDKMNVPLATQLIHYLRYLPELPDIDLGRVHCRHTLCFFGQMLWYFVAPFVEHTMTLGSSCHIFRRMLTCWQLVGRSAAPTA
jgi:hypothetical protein